MHARLPTTAISLLQGAAYLEAVHIALAGCWQLAMAFSCSASVAPLARATHCLVLDGGARALGITAELLSGRQVQLPADMKWLFLLMLVQFKAVLCMLGLLHRFATLAAPAVPAARLGAWLLAAAHLLKLLAAQHGSTGKWGRRQRQLDGQALMRGGLGVVDRCVAGCPPWLRYDTLQPPHCVAEPYMACPSELTTVLDMLQKPTFSDLQAALARHPQLSGALLGVLLPAAAAAAVGLGLPAERRPAGLDWKVASGYAGAFSSLVLLNPALDQLEQAAMRDSSGPEAASLARLLQSAAALVRHMPDGLAAEDSAAFVGLLGMAALRQRRASGCTAGQLQNGCTLNEQQLRRYAAQLLPVVPKLTALLGAPVGRELGIVVAV